MINFRIAARILPSLGFYCTSSVQDSSLGELDLFSMRAGLLFADGFVYSTVSLAAMIIVSPFFPCINIVITD